MKIAGTITVISLLLWCAILYGVVYILN